MALKIFRRCAGIALAVLLIGGWGAGAHAQACYSANCWMRIDEAHDPAYQAAIHGAVLYPYYSPYTYSYLYPYYAPSAYYPYYPGYAYQYQYYSSQTQYQYGY